MLALATYISFHSQLRPTDEVEVKKLNEVTGPEQEPEADIICLKVTKDCSVDKHC
jgi:hypothetical protein